MASLDYVNKDRRLFSRLIRESADPNVCQNQVQIHFLQNWFVKCSISLVYLSLDWSQTPYAEVINSFENMWTWYIRVRSVTMAMIFLSGGSRVRGSEVISVPYNRGLPKGLSQSCHVLLVCPEMKEAQWWWTSADNTAHQRLNKGVIKK